MLKRSKKTKLAAVVSSIVMATTAATATTASAYHLIGDVNQDGFVDASDASQVLSYYAMASTGQNADINYTVADVNCDGFVDASDASCILAYYASLSTGHKAIWPARPDGLDKMTLKPAYVWVAKELPDYSSNTVALLNSDYEIYVLEKSEDNDWYFVEFNRSEVGYINVTDYELTTFFNYEPFNNPETTATSSEETSTTTTSVVTYDDYETTTGGTTATTDNTTATGSSTTIIDSTTVTSSSTTVTESSTTEPETTITTTSTGEYISVLHLKPCFTWEVKNEPDIEANKIFEISDTMDIYVIETDDVEKWYYVKVYDVDDEVKGYIYIPDRDMDNCFVQIG